MPMFVGTPIKIGDEEFIVPPLSLGQLRNGAMTKLKEHDTVLASGDTWGAMVLRGEIILEALRRNYPEFDDKKLYDWLDVGNCGPLWLSVLGASGFTPGEVKAAGPAVNGTSNQSTAALPPLTDGLITK
jgi:hypothetical protein